MDKHDGLNGHRHNAVDRSGRRRKRHVRTHAAAVRHGTVVGAGRHKVIVRRTQRKRTGVVADLGRGHGVARHFLGEQVPHRQAALRRVLHGHDGRIDRGERHHVAVSREVAVLHERICHLEVLLHVVGDAVAVRVLGVRVGAVDEVFLVIVVRLVRIAEGGVLHVQLPAIGHVVAVRVGIGAERENAETERHGVEQGLLRGEAVGIVREKVVDFLVNVLFAGVPRERVRGVGVRDRVRLVRDDVDCDAVARHVDELVIVLAPLLAR